MDFDAARPEDAFAAIAWLIIIADVKGTHEEMAYLHKKLLKFDVFLEYSETEFVNLMGVVLGLIEAGKPASDKSDYVANLCLAVGKVLNHVQRREAFVMAAELACTDGMCPEEIVVLTQLQAGLNIEANEAQQIISRTTAEAGLLGSEDHML